MNESFILVVDYEKICRLCLRSTGGMTELFENNEENSIQKLVAKATGLEIQANDAFPSKICYRCRYLVESSCELKDMATKTQCLLLDASKSDFRECTNETENSEAKDTEISENQKPKHIKKMNCAKYKKEQWKKKRDLKLVMQENGVMTLVKQDAQDQDDLDENTSFENESCNYEKEDHSENDGKYITSYPSNSNKVPKHLTCQMCLTAFCSIEEVRVHVEAHYVDSNLTAYVNLQRPYHCEACNNKEISKKQLILHHRRHLNINPFICKHTDCSFIGQSQDALRRHMVCHLARACVCEICGASYRRGAELRAHHARAHSVSGEWWCYSCRKRFRNKLSLRTHSALCRRPRKYRCEWAGCSKAYHSRAELATHARTHTDERVFKCHLCDVAAYTSQSMLNRHLRMHKRARLSKCDKCAATFEDYGDFYRHRIAEHGPWQPYKCLGCNKRYQSETKLEKHVETCERAMVVKSLGSAEHADGKAEQIMVTSIEEIISSENEVLQVQREVSGDVLDKLKGQSLLLQPGDIQRGQELVLQELPPDSLLYIEVDAETEEISIDEDWQQ